MSPGLLIRLRPTGPWRIGPDSGDRDRVDRIYHSDSLYSALCSAMAQLGELENWLAATAQSSQPAVRLSSCFPFHADTRYVVPPRSMWPPAASSKIRWKAARFIPLSLVESLLKGQPVSEDAWTIDVPSECLIPSSTSQGPFRISVRSSAAVDRDGSAVLPHSSACLEFTPSSGLWMAAGFSSPEARDRWTAPLTAALRLLADSGFGGERSRGWGRSEMPEITSGDLPDLLLRSPNGQATSGHWLLSLFHPSSDDQVDWTQGNYALHTRSGRVESDVRHGEAKKPTRMVAEGSVLVAAAALRGEATDVAPEGFPHPVYRSGFAFAVPLPFPLARVPSVRAPLPVPVQAAEPVETTATEPSRNPQEAVPEAEHTQLDLLEPVFLSPDDQAEDLAVNPEPEPVEPDSENTPPAEEDAE
jgi:CRISPR type III-A-associated RAMP protein Csm4